MSNGLSFEMIKKHAATLPLVLKMLRKELPEVDSDKLWQAIQARWSEKELEKTIASFEKNGRIAAFRKLFDVLPQAGADGFFEADGERWGTRAAISRHIGISNTGINPRLPSCRSRNGKDGSGAVQNFYSLMDVENACADLLRDIQQADPDGFFEADGEKWGTRGAFSRQFSINKITAKKHLSSCRSREGKDQTGRVMSFYALTDAEKACADLLRDIPRAGPDGFFEADGEKWGTCKALVGRLGISDSAITPRLSSCRSRKGKGQVGHVLTFYALTDVEKACVNLLTNTMKAGKNGFIEVNDESWGTCAALARRFGLRVDALKKRISSCRSLNGKTSSGFLATFYALTDAEKACADLLRDIPRAGPDGFFEADGERWGTLAVIGRQLGVSWLGMKPRISSCRSRDGRAPSGFVTTFYALTDVEKACADLLRDIPRAGPDGFFEADGERWGTCRALSHLLGISGRTVSNRLTSCRSQEGKVSGQVGTFYALTDVEKACADLLRDIPRAGPDGFFEADGERWGTRKAICRRLSVNALTVQRRLPVCRSRDGKDQTSRIATFYSLSDMQKACVDLLRKKRRRKTKR